MICEDCSAQLPYDEAIKMKMVTLFMRPPYKDGKEYCDTLWQCPKCKKIEVV